MLMLRTVLCTLMTVSFPAQSLAKDSAAVTDAPQTSVFKAPKDGGPRRWRVKALNGVTLREGPSSDVAALTDLKEGTLLINLGCQPTNNGIWCKARPLRSRFPGYVEAKHLDAAVAEDGTVPTGINTSATRVRKGDFDATGNIPCAQIRGQAVDECSFAVARSSGGDAAVQVTFSNGFRRTLFFIHGEFVSADATMSGTGWDSDWRVVDDKHVIRVEDQRYQVPDSAIYGN